MINSGGPLDTLEAYYKQRENAPASKDIQALAKICIEQGKEQMLKQLQDIVNNKKLTRCEVAMLTGHLREILINNGIILRRNTCSTSKSKTN